MPEPTVPQSTTPRPAARRFPIWWVVAALALVVGYVDLARGGTTLAPFLLVLAYCVLIPLAILK
jgi:hypothetical protein